MPKQKKICGASRWIFPLAYPKKIAEQSARVFLPGNPWSKKGFSRKNKLFF